MKVIKGYSGLFRKNGVEVMVTVQASCKTFAVDKITEVGFEITDVDNIKETMTIRSDGEIEELSFIGANFITTEDESEVEG
jgi:hypothetical protein